jgi:hypothetical protein
VIKWQSELVLFLLIVMHEKIDRWI